MSPVEGQSKWRTKFQNGQFAHKLIHIPARAAGSIAPHFQVPVSARMCIALVTCGCAHVLCCVNITSHSAHHFATTVHFPVELPTPHASIPAVELLSLTPKHIAWTALGSNDGNESPRPLFYTGSLSYSPRLSVWLVRPGHKRERNLLSFSAAQQS